MESFPTKEKLDQVAREELCPIQDECILLNDEKIAKNNAINRLSEIDRLLEIIVYSVDTFVDSLGDLLSEVQYKVNQGLKLLDPDFPWEDPNDEKETPEVKETTISYKLKELFEKLVGSPLVRTLA